MRSFLKDPLAHFLAAGFLLFAAASAIRPAPLASDAIIVDRAALLTFIQYRSKAFEPRAAAALLDSMDAATRERLISDFTREEALAREAAALGLDANDYVIRQRMVQKVEFLAEAAIATPELGPEEVEAFYEANRERYASPPSATLTHVFVSSEEKGAEAARAQAVRLLGRLVADRAGFNDAPKYGERFLYHKNYVDRTDDYIRSQLGDAAADAVFDPSAPLETWRGPFRSEFGEHLVYVTVRSPARVPPLDEIADLVKSDLAEERRRLAKEQAIDGIVAKYRVEVLLGDDD